MAQLQRLAIAPSQLQDQQIALTLEQQHYLGRVLRLQPGDRFIAMNGQGQWWLAVLDSSLAKAEIVESLVADTELPVAVTLMVALPKGSGFEEVVRQATEIGVNCLVPVVSDRTLLKPSPQKLERWRRITQEAAEQSERQIVPAVLDPISFKDSLKQLIPQPTDNSVSQAYLCVTRRSSPHLFDCLRSQAQLTPSPSIVIATGPEGGWTDLEVEQAIAAGYQPVSLGRRILRAVTAPIVALSLVAAAYESPTATQPLEP